MHAESLGSTISYKTGQPRDSTKSQSTLINLSMSSIDRNTVPVDEYRPFMSSTRFSVVAYLLFRACEFNVHPFL